MKAIVLAALVLLAGCGGDVPPRQPLQAPSFAPRYPYFYTLQCNGKLVTVTVTGPSMEPVTCAEAPH